MTPLPKNLLYSTSARLGGYGLDLHTLEAVKGAYRAGILGRAVTYANRQREVPSRLIQSLRWHPVRLLSFLESQTYYGAKKYYVDWAASQDLKSGRYDLFHGWSGESLQSLRVAHQLGIPSVIDIPTWHRHKGKRKSAARTRNERAQDDAPFPHNWLNKLKISRQHMLEEYDLATLLIVYSECAAETFVSAGIAREKLHYLPLGTDIERFTPGKQPDIFRAVYSGALIKRKGVHLLLKAWHKLNLKKAELVLVGAVHDEMKPYLEQYMRDNVTVVGFAARPEEYLRTSSVHIFPSTCEGSAKTTYDAAACGLAQITTRESGDVVVDGETGLIIPANDFGALSDAIEKLYENPELVKQMGLAARQRVEENFTWDMFRERLLGCYSRAMEKVLTRNV